MLGSRAEYAACWAVGSRGSLAPGGRAVDGSPGTRQEVGEAQGREGPGLLPALQGDEVT